MASLPDDKSDNATAASSAPNALALDIVALTRRCEEALALLDDDKASEYRQAVQAVPHLVLQESQTIHFLIASHLDPQAAAERKAMYWKVRKELFGKERWLLPMTCTGRGALTTLQVEILRTGFMAVTPRAVFMADMSRLPRGAALLQPQVIFYMCSVSAAVACTGMQILQIIHSGKRPPPQTSPEIVQRMNQALPYRMGGLIVAQTYEPGREHLLDYLSFAQKRVLETNMKKSATSLVADPSMRNTLLGLQERGLHRSCIPAVLGGDFDMMREVDIWIRARLSLEDGMGAAHPVRNTETAAAAAVACHETWQQEQEKQTTVMTTTTTTTTTTVETSTNAATPSTTTQGQSLKAPPRPSSLLLPPAPPLLLPPGTQQQAAAQSTRPPPPPSAAANGESAASVGLAGPSATWPRPSRTYARRNQFIGELQQSAAKWQEENKRLVVQNRKLEAALAQARLIVAVANSNDRPQQSPDA